MVVVLGIGNDLFVGELAHHLADRALVVGHVLQLRVNGHGKGDSSVSEKVRPRIPAAGGGWRDTFAADTLHR